MIGPLDPWHWHARPVVALVLLVLAALYLRGWWRLRGHHDRALASAWRLSAYLAGLGAVALALLSPLDSFAGQLFTAHMIQHQILLMVAPPCLLLANPFPFAVWGMPPALRRIVQRFLVDGSPARRGLRAATRLPVAGLVYAGTLWAWHWPPAYELALRHGLVHDLEHLTFFGAALLFWWPIVNPAPRARGHRGGLYYGFRVAYLVVATAQNTLLGAIIGLTERVLYPTYAGTAGEPFGLSALADQAFGGGLMWSGGHVYLIAILFLLWEAMEGEDRRPAPAPVAGRPRAGS